MNGQMSVLKDTYLVKHHSMSYVKSKNELVNKTKYEAEWNFLGSPVVKTVCTSTARDAGSIPGWKAKISHAVQCGKKKKKPTQIWEVNGYQWRGE